MSAVEDGTFDRWRGGVDEKLRTHADDLKDLRRDAARNDARIGILEVAIGKLSVKLGMAAALGSIVGGGVVSFLVLWASHHIH